MKKVTYRLQANLRERVNRNLVQIISSFIEENHENWDRFLQDFAFALRTSGNETINKTPAELFLGRKIITHFSNLINVTGGAECVGINIEKLFDEARQNMRKQHKIWEKYYNRNRREVNINVINLVLSVGGSNNNLIIWKNSKRVTVNIDQVRVYRPRQSDTISSDSHVETLYEGQRSGNGSSRSQPGKFKGSRKPSSEESIGLKSNKGNSGLEDPRLKHIVGSNASVDRKDLKMSKICRKRYLQGSEHRNQKRPTLEPKQGIKRAFPTSVSSLNYKCRRPNNSSQGSESIASPSHQRDTRQSIPPTEGSRYEGSGQFDKAQEIRTTKSGTNRAAERRPVLSKQATAVRPLSLLPTQPSETAQRNSRGTEEHRNRQYSTEQHQEKKLQYGSLKRRSGG
ncbi:uncharacterized protein TNCV_3110721 [Trichonephila clavipes]|nr:uncharacterized protein TNCV_3110721 [Trichonephila clavipes]